MSQHDEDQRQRVADRLREARKLAGLSQGKVAQMMSLHRPAVSEIEGGNRRVSAEELTQFAKIYDVNVTWLLGAVSEETEGTDPKVQMAARELSKLKPENLDRLLRILAAMRADDDQGEQP